MLIVKGAWFKKIKSASKYFFANISFYFWNMYKTNGIVKIGFSFHAEMKIIPQTNFLENKESYCSIYTFYWWNRIWKQALIQLDNYAICFKCKYKLFLKSFHGFSFIHYWLLIKRHTVLALFKKSWSIILNLLT